MVRHIQELAIDGSSSGAILRALRETEPADSIPTERTISDIAREARQAADRDKGERWTFLDDDGFSPEDARLVMDLLAGHESIRQEWIAKSEYGVVPRTVIPRRPSRELARMVVRIRRAYPSMPPQAASTFAYQYLAVSDDRAATERLDYELALWGLRQEWEENPDD